MQSDTVTYTRAHVELLVKLAFVRGQEFATANMLKDATERVALAIGAKYEHVQPEAAEDSAVVERKTGCTASACA